MRDYKDVVVIISAETEWRVVCEGYEGYKRQKSSFGEFFEIDINISGKPASVIFFHGGWGKICAAASTQYAIDRWNPSILINLGTCGGIEGKIDREAIVLVEKTIVYDIVEKMGGADEAIQFYTTEVDLSWITGDYPTPVRKSLLISADRDLLPEEIPILEEKYGAVAGDWESGAIAYVCARNHKKCMILRGVTDLVGKSGGEAYDHVGIFETNTRKVMQNLLTTLPLWLERCQI
jgi:adenosylhomocysteine nucleosidase